ncbi:outer membrane lipoprotein LolB [Bathymodiolus japonicus methanotrophic gill symbiont]|uniref:lipoprotein insertase outer membrane protein LolB n=1 Tax=Bathymodiolus japonicus methanotrophic gill symbiont TaxID=113269 RepID=UPI001B5B415C|nr:lipoprotein insertase outer membrane protein LolB [Bathymodiolus japonicus methanotrophic gill symbiont]GFO71657.1 outer membrane lipoprotein LolB [Bathymodiolus japonicus methanotrophic gill symbiont]
MRAGIACMILLVLAGCNSVKTYDAKYAQHLSQQQRLDIERWNMQGRLLIRSDEMLTANLQWQHNKQKDMLKLSGALGLGAMQIELDEHEIVLHDAQGGRQASQDIDAFIARQIGFVAPITALRRWVLGAYLNGVPVVLQENGFLQLGWRITFKEYMDTAAGILPHSITITKNNIKLKLIVDRWEIE